MKTSPIVLSVSLATMALALGAAPEPAAQLQSYPKNLARQHLGAGLFHFAPDSQTYRATEASAAWLDDDVTTGWPAFGGKQYYMLALPQAELMTNFSLSTKPAAGTVTLYVGDTPAPPTAKSWNVVAREVPLDQINQRKLSKPFSRLGKYLLIETDIAEPGPVYGLYVYGDKPAAVFALQPRETPIDSRAVFGPYVNDRTAFNTASLYSGALVTSSNSSEGSTAWQRMLDDNPESGVTLAASTDKPGGTVQLGGTRSVSRVAALVDPGAAGKLDVFLTNSPTPAETLTDMIPTISIALDGSNARQSLDFPAVQANAMLVRWTPSDGTSSVTVREVATYGDATLAANTVQMAPEAIAEYGGEDAALLASGDGKSGKNFKDVTDPKDLPPIAEMLSQRSPFLPGSLGFPPNITGRLPGTPVLPPDEPASTP